MATLAQIRHQAEQTPAFDGVLDFCSNFFPSPLLFEGMRFATVEHAFQAAKSTDPLMRAAIANARSAGHAKRMGGKRGIIVLRNDWEEIKIGVMEHLLTLKFQDPALAARLRETSGTKLLELNHWHDRFWGVCTCSRCGSKGLNQLGALLSTVRARLA